MKFKNILFILLLFLVYQGQSQDHQLKSWAVHMNGTVYLRQFTDAQPKYDLIKEHGIMVYRETVSANGTWLNPSNWDSTRVFIDHQFPISEAQVLQDTASNDMYKLAYFTQYSDLYKPVPANENDLKFSDVYEADQYEDLRFALLAIGVDKDFDLAMDMGLGLKDTTVQANHRYKYFSIIVDTISGDTLSYPVFSLVSTYDNTLIAPLESLEGEGKQGEVLLSWKANGITPSSSYNIYRSEDSVQFSKINTEAFVPVFAEDDEEEVIYYRDSLAEQAQTYHYLIRGISPFGFETDASDIISVETLPPRIEDLKLKVLDPIIDEGIGSIKIRWSCNDAYDTEMQYHILRSNDYYGKYDTLTINSLLAGSTRSYEDFPSQNQNYYQIIGYDTNGYDYESIITFGQLSDTIPPTAPTNLSTRYIADDAIELTWAANTEEDLRGYRVFVSNQRDGTYVQVTSQAIQNTQYVHTFDNQIIGDSLFFKVLATDKTKNYSLKSNEVASVRRDDVPPSRPLLREVIPTSHGIGFNFDFSSTESVNKHLLQRKLAIEPEWTTILIIPKSQFNNYTATDSTFSYFDSTALEQQAYDFRIIAQDVDYKQSSSLSIQATPTLISTSGSVTNFRLNHETEPDTSNLSINQRLENLNEVLEGKNRFRAVNEQIHHVDLSWTAPMDQNLMDFQVYRKVTGGPFELYRTITIHEGLDLDAALDVVGALGQKTFQFRDENLIKGKRYTYKVVTRRKDGSSTQNSMLKTIKL